MVQQKTLCSSEDLNLVRVSDINTLIIIVWIDIISVSIIDQPYVLNI